MIFTALILAAAIQTSSTTCRTFMGTTTCDTQAQVDPMVAFNRNVEAAAEASGKRREQQINTLGYRPDCAGRMWLLDCTRGEHDAAVAGIAAKEASEELRRQVTGLLASDDCPGAIMAALAGGDMNLAREARDFCRP